MSTFARAWRNFRRWRRGRPFWGGLFTLLAGLEIFASTQLTDDEFQLKVGLEGFQSYVIPAALILAGLLTWFTPEQRIFYGVLAAFISVYSLIGVNLGGFFIGMLLGVIGGSLTASWTPVERQPQPPDEEDEGDETDDDEPPPGDDGERYGGTDWRGSTRVEDLPTVPLADIVPTSSPMPQPGPTSSGDEAAGGDEQPPRGGSLPHRSPQLFAIMLVPIALTAAMTALPKSPPALADPCPVPTAATASASPTPPTAIPSNTPTRRDARGRALPQPVAPTGSPTPASAAAPATRRPPPQRPCRSVPPAPARPRVSGLAAGQPPVARQPGRLTGTRISLVGLTFDGIVDLSTVGGTIRVLRFSMDSSTTNDFELRIAERSGATVSLRSAELTVRGNVEFYTNRFTGKLLGQLEVTFTPEAPPPPHIPPNVFFTDPDIQLVFVTADTLAAESLLTVL